MPIPSRNRQLTAPQPPAGGCAIIATTALTMGAPANTIAITTAGVPFAEAEWLAGWVQALHPFLSHLPYQLR